MTRVRRLEDRVRRAVVLLERDRLRAGEVALELEDVADVGAAERVDRLVRVADGADVPVLARRGAAAAGTARGSCPGTRRRGRSGTPSASSRAPRGSARSTSTVSIEQVVEVDRVRGEQPLLVELVDVGDRLVVERLHARAYSSGPISWFFACEIWVWMPRGVKRFGSRSSSSRHCLDEAHLVGLVVDREVRAVAEPLRLAAEDAAAGGVEGEDPDARARGAEQPLEPLAHLPARPCS